MNRPLIPRRAPHAPLQRISRRGLITSGVLAGVLAASGVPVHAQRRGGTLRIAVAGTFDGWGIGRQELAARLLGAGTLFDTLTEITATGELAGALATAWRADAGGAVWTLTLRPDVTFHDGRPVTAADVVASILRHHDGASPLGWFMGNLSGATAPDAATVRLTLHYPDPDLPLILADPHLMIAPGGAVEQGVGSGLYQRSGDDPLRVTRVIRHWRDGQGGWFDGVTLILTDDPGGAVLAGLADVAPLAVAGADLLQASAPASSSLLLTAPPGLSAALATRGRPDLAGIEAGYSPDPSLHVVSHVRALAHAGTISGLAPLDNARIAQRWWFA
jgi:peptide/nickel transport system substrate-binding protein